MNLALDSAHCLIAAGADAPDRAHCPHCGAVVVLRRRRRSQRPGDETYFWRHLDNASTLCPARFVAGKNSRGLG